MGKPGAIYDKLFQAIVIVGAAAGAAACDDEESKPKPDAGTQVADAPPADAGTDAPPFDAILIL